MRKVKVLVTLPEFQDNQKYLDQIAAVSSRLEIERRVCKNLEETAASLGDAEILYTLWIPACLQEGHQLRWVQMSSTGIDNKLDNPIFDPESKITVTNAAGCHAPAIGEYILAVMMMLVRGFLQFHRDQQAKIRDRSHSTLSNLWGKTVGIIGYGHIGREVARLAQAHNMRVLATNREAGLRQGEGYQINGFGDPEGLIPEEVFGPDDLDALLEQSDFAVCTAPLTKQTAGMCNAFLFKRMKRTAFLINASRGGLVDHDALVSALQNQEIAGAGLDVTFADPKPLPEDHPLWEMDNVFLTPHVSGNRSAEYVGWVNELFCVNLKRYLDGEPLINVVSRARGY